MTLYDLWLNLLQAWVSTLTFCKNHPAVPGLLFLTLRLNSIRRAINKNLPKQFRDTTDADILEIKEDLKLIKKHLGVIGEWQSNGLQSGLKRHPPSFSKLLKYLRKATKSVYPQRRKTKMNSQNVNYMTLIPTILGAAKLILQTFGIDIPDATVNEVVNGAAAVGTIIGIFLSHRKTAAAQPVQSDPNKFIQG